MINKNISVIVFILSINFVEAQVVHGTWNIFGKDEQHFAEQIRDGNDPASKAFKAFYTEDLVNTSGVRGLNLQAAHYSRIAITFVIDVHEFYTIFLDDRIFMSGLLRNGISAIRGTFIEGNFRIHNAVINYNKNGMAGSILPERYNLGSEIKWRNAEHFVAIIANAELTRTMAHSEKAAITYLLSASGREIIQQAHGNNIDNVLSRTTKTIVHIKNSTYAPCTTRHQIPCDGFISTLKTNPQYKMYHYADDAYYHTDRVIVGYNIGVDGQFVDHLYKIKYYSGA